MAKTPNLAIDLMAANDTNKEVLFNEAIVTLDALVARSAKARQNNPPASPAAGSTYIVGATPTGAWAGRANRIALFFNGWRFYTPTTKMKFFNEADARYWTYNAGAWTVDPVTAVSTLDDLANVSASSPNNGDVLVFNTATSTWHPQPIPMAAFAIANATDVDMDGIANGQVLIWDATEGKLKPGAVPAPSTALADLSDVDMSAVGNNRVLRWNTSTGKAEWVLLSIPSPVNQLHHLQDVEVTGAVDGDALIFNGGVWTTSSAAWNYSFVGMIDGPQTFEGAANKFLRVNAIETGMEFATLSEILAASTLRAQDMADVQTPVDADIGKVLRIQKTAGNFHYVPYTLPNYSVPFFDGETQLTTRVMSLRFDGFDISEPTEGNIVVTAAPTLSFQDDGTDIAAAVTKMNFTGELVVEEEDGVLTVSLDIPEPVVRLSGLEDVTISAESPPADGQALIYDYANETWKPGSVSSVIPEIEGVAKASLYEMGPLAPPAEAMFPLRHNAPSMDFLLRDTRGLVVFPGPHSTGTVHAWAYRKLTNDEAPWEVTCRVVPSSFGAGGHAAGIALIRTVNNSGVFINIGNSDSENIASIRFGHVSVTGAETIVRSEPNLYNWLRLAFDGNDIRGYVSIDGLVWLPFGLVSANTVLGGVPTHVGLDQRNATAHAGNVGALYTFYEDPDYPAEPRIVNAAAMATLAYMSGLGDVELDGLVDGHTLVWDDANNVWKNAPGGGGGSGDTLPALTGNEGKVLRVNATATDVEWSEGGGEAEYPDMTGKELQFLRVNADGDGVEWATPAGGSAEYPSMTGQAGKVLAVKATEDDVEWIDPPSGGGGGGVEEAPVDGKQYGRVNGAWAEIVPPASVTGRVSGSFSITGALADDALLHEVIYPATLGYPLSMDGSFAYVRTAPTGADLVIEIARNDLPIGTLTFEADSNEGVFSTSSTLVLGAGDRLSFTAPASALGAAGLSVTLVGSLL